MQGLLPGTEYSVRVVAQNENGPRTSSEELEVVTQAEVDVPGPPQAIEARATSSFSILITWALPAGNNGNILKYKLYYRQVKYLHKLTYCEILMRLQNTKVPNCNFVLLIMFCSFQIDKI